MESMHSYTIPVAPKSLRETLCLAQNAIARRPFDDGRKESDLRTLQYLIDECDRKRPTYPDGKHHDLHTPECGCEDI